MIKEKSLAVLKRYFTKKTDNAENNVIENGVYCNGFLIVRSMHTERIILKESMPFKVPDIEKLKEYNFETKRKSILERKTLTNLFNLSKTIQDFQISFKDEEIILVNDNMCLKGSNELIDLNMSFNGKNFRNFLEYALEEFNGELELSELIITKNGKFFANALKISENIKNCVILLDVIMPERIQQFVIEQNKIIEKEVLI